MRRLNLLLLLPLTAAAGDWRLTARGGMRFYEDAAFDLVDEAPFRGAGEIGLDYALLRDVGAGELWIGASFQGGARVSEVHEHVETRWDVAGWRAYASYRWRAYGPLALHGRLGPAVSWTTLTLTDGARELEADDYSLGIHGGLGLDLFLLHRDLLEGYDRDFSLGLSLEATYARFLPLELEAGGTALGEIDPSGPGWLLGLVAEW